MGRCGYKTEADGLKKISVWQLKRWGYFQGWHSGAITWTSSWDESKSSVSVVVSTLDEEGYLRIYYTQTDYYTEEKKDFDYQIPLTTTSCHFGGKRYWFICPWYKNGVHCGRRVGVLYKGGDYFACRHCYYLTYSSQKESRSFRYSSLFNTVRIEDKIDKLSSRIKRPYYGGRPTRKQRRLEWLYEQAGISYKRLKADKMLK